MPPKSSRSIELEIGTPEDSRVEIVIHIILPECADPDFEMKLHALKRQFDERALIQRNKRRGCGCGKS